MAAAEVGGGELAGENVGGGGGDNTADRGGGGGPPPRGGGRGPLPRCELAGEDVEVCGSSNPATEAVDPVRAPEAHASQIVSLDDEMWSVRVEFEDSEHIEMSMAKSDITYLHLLALIESKGYGIGDTMYCYVADGGDGLPRYLMLDGMGKVLQMLVLCQQKQAITVIVMKQKNKPTSCAAEDSYALNDDEDLLYLGSSQKIPADCLFSQQSNNMKNGKNICVEENKADIFSDLEDYYFAEEYDAQLREEKIELSQRLEEMKRRRENPGEHIEGDTDVDDLFCHSDSDDDGSTYIQMVLPEDEPAPEKRRKLTPVKKGPIERSHCSTQSKTPAYYVPSSDSGSDGDLKKEDDDGAAMAWAVPSDRKSRAKKRAARVWYDEDRLQPEDQLCLKMCFIDVYQFRRALEHLHIAQLRNYGLHRNGPNRVIAQCAERETQGCQFYMVGSTIGKEKTFCLRKLNLEHTCANAGESCKVTGKWVAKVCERNMRMDPRTNIDTVMDTANEKYGVEVGKVMAYRARKRAL